MDRTIETLLGRQARRWQIEQGAGMPRPRGPVVALSRWTGALGDEVGHAVAEWLDYGLFGAEAVDQLAHEPALLAQLVAGLDDAERASIAAQVRAFGERVPGAPTGVVGVVAALGVRGMAVVLGRGAAAILPPERALRVLVVAPRALRIERLARAQALPAAEAEACVASADAAREAALHERFGIAAEDLTHYDVVLNTESLSADAAAALVVDALRRRFPLR